MSFSLKKDLRSLIKDTLSLIEKKERSHIFLKNDEIVFFQKEIEKLKPQKKENKEKTLSFYMLSVINTFLVVCSVGSNPCSKLVLCRPA